jgi:valyl-tRNA synthetase
MADYEIGQRHPEISTIEIIGEDGRMTEKAGARYTELRVEEAREKIVEDLKKLGLLIKTEDYDHSVARCGRCSSVIEPLLSNQWFLSISELARQAESAIKKNKINFVPESKRDQMLDWIANIKDWNISRQLWWGHRIPAWYCGCINNTSWHVGITPPTEPCKKCRVPWIESTDVLDTWFSSALWPFVTLHWPEETSDLKNFYPSAVISSAREIFSLWIFRMLFSGLEFMGEPPFKTIFTHSTILDTKGRKMSKSVGNVVDPMKLIDVYGIDAMRFGLVWQAMSTQDIHWSEDPMRAGKKFLNKLWNSWRFIAAHVGSIKRPLKRPRPSAPGAIKILDSLEALEKNIASKFETFEFGSALHDIYDFYWHEFCDVFLEEAKRDPSLETKQTLLYVFCESLKLLHPFLPFITEYIWSLIYPDNKRLLIVEKIT